MRTLDDRESVVIHLLSIVMPSSSSVTANIVAHSVFRRVIAPRRLWVLLPDSHENGDVNPPSHSSVSAQRLLAASRGLRFDEWQQLLGHVDRRANGPSRGALWLR